MASSQSEPNLGANCRTDPLSPLSRFLPLFQLSHTLPRCFLSKVSMLSGRKGGMWQLGRLGLVGAADPSN